MILDRKSYAGALLMDLFKTFDCVNWENVLTTRRETVEDESKCLEMKGEAKQMFLRCERSS